MMDGFDPASSFGPNVAVDYDKHPRGDEEAAATFLSDLAQGEVVHLSSQLALDAAYRL